MGYFIKKMGLIVACLLLTGCMSEKYKKIPGDMEFVATFNQLDRSITFFNEKFEVVTTWSLEEKYSGATLIGNDAIALFGPTVDNITIYQLSTGEEVTKIKDTIGTTNVIYDDKRKLIYVANKEHNTISKFDLEGNYIAEIMVGNYPLTMEIEKDSLYVLNFKSDYLSVVDLNLFEESEQLKVPSSSNGLIINSKLQEIWIGGHGEHTSNREVLVISSINGEVLKRLPAPEMPIALAQSENLISVISHGSNMLYQFSNDGKKVNEIEVGANPFTVAYFNNFIITAGYDDNTMYVINKNGDIQSYATGNGPFQLVIRELLDGNHINSR